MFYEVKNTLYTNLCKFFGNLHLNKKMLNMFGNKIKYCLSNLLEPVLICRGAENVRTLERGSGEILINNLKSESKWKFLLTGVNFHKHQNK